MQKYQNIDILKRNQDKQEQTDGYSDTHQFPSLPHWTDPWGPEAG